MKHAPFFLLKARAEQIPLRDNSVSLVIATPPYLGVKRIPQKDCCTQDPEQYDALLARFLDEATRIVKPGGHILLHTDEWPAYSIRGSAQIVFQVFQKCVRRGLWAHRWVGSRTFRRRYRSVEGCRWAALPIRLYRDLVRGYSKPGEVVAHVFSGSGNGAIAALQSSRKPLLLDLHYHRQIKRRLNERIQRKPEG